MLYCFREAIEKMEADKDSSMGSKSVLSKSDFLNDREVKMIVSSYFIMNE